MINYLYLIYDKIARNTFGMMIRVGNDEVARRSFHNTLAHKDSPLAGHEADYKLIKVGQIDETTGIITGYDIAHDVADGGDWLNANKEHGNG